MRELADLVPGSFGPEGRVRCFGHVLNIVVKGIMSQFGRRRGRAVDPALAALGDPEDVDVKNLEAAKEADEDREAADQAELDRLEEENESRARPIRGRGQVRAGGCREGS